MTQFFLSILIIVCGGMLSLAMARQDKPMRTVAVALIGSGCFLGLADAATTLIQTGMQTASFSYLGVFSLSFRVDALAAFFLAAIFAVSLLAVIYSFHYMEHEKSVPRAAAGYFFFSILIVSMAMVVAADTILTFMLAWELMSLSSFFLVIYNHEAAENRKAGYLYFVFSHIGAMFIFASFGLIYGCTGSFMFGEIGAVPECMKLIAFFLAFVGFGSKAGVFPFHVWLPHAHPAAPSHISAVMSGVMIKTGIYGILRMYTLLACQDSIIGTVILVAGVTSGILGVVYALGQNDIKRLLAYSSVENIGIILIGMGLGMIGVSSGSPMMAALGFTGCLLHVMNHAVFKSLLFMGAGMVVHKTGTRSIDSMGGLLKSMKITGTTFVIGSLAIAGLPPLNGFMGEFFIYIGGFKGIALEKSAFVMSIVGIIGLAVIGGLALACFTRVIGVVFQGEPRSRAAVNVNEKGTAMKIPMGVLALLCLVIGIFPGTAITMALKAVSTLGPVYGQVPLEPFQEMAGNISLGAVVFLAVLLLIINMRSLFYKDKIVGRSGTWGCGFTQPTSKMQYTGMSYAGSILEFFKPAAPLTVDHPVIRGRFPQKTHYTSYISDIAERHMTGVVVRPILFVFDRLRWIQHGDIHLYIGYILLAIVLLLFFV